MSKPAAATEGTAVELYLDLLKKCLTRYIFGERYRALEPDRHHRVRRVLYQPLERLLRRRDLALVRRARFDPRLREEGRDWPAEAETMAGLKRLANVQRCITEVVGDDIPGDL